ncbi:MAG: ferredoxin:glutaredoxin reductase [Euryarchaeota archaeon]|nr:ferredoxin:glutaredoxin reductase [Euryarchaeota archaeon]
MTERGVEELHLRLKREAEGSGYHLNPDEEFTLEIVKGLIKNEKRYGYWACPCRLASGNKSEDLDIICPCDYRDADLADFGSCLCGLYVTEDWIAGNMPKIPVPERRPVERSTEAFESQVTKEKVVVWRCRVCGYLCAREQPPEVCPICKANKERFEQFTLK